jgi:lipoprotein-anchoring transpeptidase ErfK/SrfK
MNALKLLFASLLGFAPMQATQPTATDLPADVEVALDEAAIASSELRLEVSVSKRELYVYKGDERLKKYTVAVGKPKHETPKGGFNVQRVIWNPSWVPPQAPWARDKKPKQPGDPQNPMGRAKIFFKYPDYYIHGTNDEKSLGKAASHGCIRMRNRDVMELARLLMENGGAERTEGWFNRVRSRVTSTQDVRLSKPIRLQVKS